MILTGKWAVKWAVSKKSVDGFTFCAFHSCDSSGPTSTLMEGAVKGVLGVRIPNHRDVSGVTTTRINLGCNAQVFGHILFWYSEFF